jgi:hypothetical protein
LAKGALATAETGPEIGVAGLLQQSLPIELASLVEVSGTLELCGP